MPSRCSRVARALSAAAGVVDDRRSGAATVGKFTSNLDHIVFVARGPGA